MEKKRMKKMENFMWSIRLWFYVLILWFYDFMYGFYVIFIFSMFWSWCHTFKIILFTQTHWQGWKSTQMHEVENAIFWQRSSKLKDKCQQKCPASTHNHLQFKNKKVPTTSLGYKRIWERHTNYDRIHQI